MPITIDRTTNIISIPQSYCTFVGGTLYKLDTDAARLDLKALEAAEEGIVFEDTHVHNAGVTVAGIDYAQSLSVVNSYQVEFVPDSQWSVVLEGSNNNFWDVEGGVLVQNQVQVIPTNSAGYVVVTQGSGVTNQDKTDIVNALVALAAEFKDKNTEQEVHTWLDTYTNKDNWKTTSVDLGPVLAAISNLNNLSLAEVENSSILAKEASLTAIAAAVAGISVGGTDITPVLTAISGLNNVTPTEVRAAFDAADFKDRNTEVEIHAWLDSYGNKDNWKASPADIASTIWEEVV